MTPEEKKAAKAAYDREYRRKNAEKIKAAKAAWGKSQVKKDYDKQYAQANKERVAEIKAAWRSRNPDAGKEYYAKNREERLAKVKAEYAANPEQARRRTKQWRIDNPEQASALAGKRATAVRRATPAWADRAKMREIYKHARFVGQEVDHIIPLQGKLVSGLHVETNLRVVPRSENRMKGNRYGY